MDRHNLFKIHHQQFKKTGFVMKSCYLYTKHNKSQPKLTIYS